MKLITYLKDGHDQLAMLIDGMLYDMDSIHPDLPPGMAVFLYYWDDYLPFAQNAEQRIRSGLNSNAWACPMIDKISRRLQMEEMLLNLGPAKGKDFATVIGPMLVTLDELEQYEIPCKENHTGKNWNLSMKCWVNDIQVSEGNLGDMDWTFAE